MSNSVHDMGGMHGFGPVEAEPNEPVFHAALGEAGARDAAGDGLHRPVDDRRRPRLAGNPAAGDLPGGVLLSALVSRLEKRVVAFDLVGEDEIEAGKSLRPGRRLNRKLTSADVPKLLTRANFERPAPAPARFKEGDRVKTRNINPATHTRLPRYARGKLGTVEAIRGCHVYPDSAAIGAGATRNGSIRWSSRRANCGARRPTRRQGVDRGVRAVSRTGVSDLR